jgi:cell wall-associated NlpC family hydrolase
MTSPFGTSRGPASGTGPSVPNSTNTPGAPGQLNDSRGNQPGGSTVGQAFQNAMQQQINQQNTTGVNAAQLPPTMQTLVYSPDVRVLISNANGFEYDVSRDLVSGTVVRKENSVSSFFCTLANTGLRYNHLFNTMDRITVFMKRVTWVQVFSGYLDLVPLYQLFPGTVEIQASCTLKRIIHTWWNPALPASVSLFQAATSLQVQEAGDGQGGGTPGAAIGSLLAALLVQVGGWNVANVHIQNFPTTFLSFLNGTLAQDIAYDNAQALKFQTMLEGTPSAGPGSYASQANLSVGATLTNTGFGTGPTGYINAIIQSCDARSLGPINQNLQNTYGIDQAAITGQATTQQAQRQAWQDTQNVADTQIVQIQNSDAAILGVACALASSNLLNNANQSVPDSLNFPYDSITATGTDIGLFNQQNSWGSTAQRMTPFDSSGLFFDQLSKLDWRNMDPATAIATVQQDPGGAATYTAFIQSATATVQSYRAGQGQFTPTNLFGIGVSSIPGISTSGVGGTVGGGLTGSGSSLPGAVTAAQTALTGPTPNSEGAINAAMTKLGSPYVWAAQGPSSFDCSGLWVWAFASINVQLPHDAASQTKINPIPPASAFRGCLINPSGEGGSGENGHVVMYLGGDQIIECTSPGGVQMGSYSAKYGSLSNAAGCGYVCQNGGANATAPFNPVATPGGGVPGTAGNNGVPGSGSVNEPIARNLFSYMFAGQFASPTADLFTGEKAFIDDQPLMSTIISVSQAGLRNFMSAPNGDFIAYYPDYFGLDGHQVGYVLEDIEIKDARIDWSDDPLTTHVYICGDWTGLGSPGEIEAMLLTAGVATVENPTLWSRLAAAAPGGQNAGMSGSDLMARYGVRPLNANYAQAGSPELEFLLACQVFTQKWAEQYKTRISITFMPEIFPSMRVQLGQHGIVVYVSEVDHQFDFENGFTTELVIMAPAAQNARQNVEGVNLGGTSTVNNANVNAGQANSGFAGLPFTSGSFFGQVLNNNSGVGTRGTGGGG